MDHQLLEQQQIAVKINMFVVYNSPSDFPGLYVARLWKGVSPTEYCIAAADLTVLRSLLQKGLTRMPRDELDDPCIVEIWM